MACCHMSRREFVRWAGLVAATPLLFTLEERSARATEGGVAAINLELVTVTETSAVLTWFTGDPLTPPDTFGRLAPMGADTEVWMGTSPRGLRQVYQDDAKTPYHYAEITGLEPGCTYFFVARSNGVPAVPSASGLGSPLGSSVLRAAAAPAASFTTPLPHAASSCSRLRSATTCTSVRPSPAWPRPCPASAMCRQGSRKYPGRLPTPRSWPRP